MAIAVYVKATILGYRLQNDATSFKNMGRFGPVFVKPDCFGLILVWVDPAFQNNGVWYHYRACLCMYVNDRVGYSRVLSRNR